MQGLITKDEELESNKGDEIALKPYKTKKFIKGLTKVKTRYNYSLDKERNIKQGLGTRVN